ncbi:TPA: helix-turn-helix domain-containing protein [Enterobacter cloacae]
MTISKGQALLIKGVIDWIEDNITEPLLIDDVADKAGYTKWHFQRMFTATAGIPLQSYIRARKLTVALHLLPKSRHSMLDFALFFNAAHQSSFNRMFKKQFGITPSQARAGFLPPASTLQPKLEIKVVDNAYT